MVATTDIPSINKFFYGCDLALGTQRWSQLSQESVSDAYVGKMEVLRLGVGRPSWYWSNRYVINRYMRDRNVCIGTLAQ